MKYLSECDVLIYDLHSGNPKDVELALAGKCHKLQLQLITLLFINLALKKYTFEEEKVLILISSLMVWNNSQPKLKEIKEGKEGEEAEEGEGGDKKEDEPAKEEESRRSDDEDDEANKPEGDEG
jgi:adenylate kinase